MKLGKFTKQPFELLSKSVLYTSALDSGDEVSSIISCTVSPSSDAEDLAASASLVSGEHVRVWFEKGIPDTVYQVTIRVQTAGGEKFEDEIICTVRDI